MLEKTKRNKIMIRGRQKAMQCDERIKNTTSLNILKECLKEEREATRTKNIRERREYLMRNRYGQAGMGSSKRTDCKRGKNTKRKGRTNPIQQNKKAKI